MEQYFYLDSEQKQYGPCSIDALRAANITRSTKVWRAGMPDWDDAGKIPELQTLFEMTPPARPVHPPHPPQDKWWESQPPCKPDSWLAWSIISVFFCCWPLSIPGIVHASKVEGLWNRGEYNQALHHARIARQWTIASAITGFVIGLIYLLFALFFSSMIATGAEIFNL